MWGFFVCLTPDVMCMFNHLQLCKETADISILVYPGIVLAASCSPANFNLAILRMESPQAECSAKRRRLIHRDMNVVAWTEGSSSEKNGDDPGKIKMETITEHEVASQVHLLTQTSTGGSGAMQGVEVFESVSAAAEELKSQGAIVREAASAARHAALPVACAEGAKPTRFMRNNLVKQSGVPGVTWKSTCFAWLLKIPKYDSNKRKGKSSRMFSVKKIMVDGRSEAEAEAAALKAAKAFHAELVRKGILEPKERDPNFTSDVPGVKWSKQSKKWRVEIVRRSNPKERGRAIHGGCFTEKAAAEAEALRLRELHGLQRQVKAVNTLATRYAGLPMFHPKVPHAGVRWNQAEKQWHAQCNIGGVNRNFRLKPKDHSEPELERSFQVAVAWRKRQEKEREKMAKSKAKAKPEKKRCR